MFGSWVWVQSYGLVDLNETLSCPELLHFSEPVRLDRVKLVVRGTKKSEIFVSRLSSLFKRDNVIALESVFARAAFSVRVVGATTLVSLPDGASQFFGNITSLGVFRFHRQFHRQFHWQFHRWNWRLFLGVEFL
jgi:hypothetical protein